MTARPATATRERVVMEERDAQQREREQHEVDGDLGHAVYAARPLEAAKCAIIRMQD